jgi:hypothetical protein
VPAISIACIFRDLNIFLAKIASCYSEKVWLLSKVVEKLQP